MRAKVELLHAIERLLHASTTQERRSVAGEINKRVNRIVESDDYLEPVDTSAAVTENRPYLDALNPPINAFNADELAKLNWLLPWAAMTVDSNGRILGDAWSSGKRSSINLLLEARLKSFAEAYPFAGKHVLEIGCFEGIHSLGCCLLGANVTAVDGRMENILKTMARLWAYGQTANCVLWNLEYAPPATLPPHWDILHHIGVLYHLSDPIGHLEQVLPKTRGAVILDTHVAPNDESASDHYEVNGQTIQYYRYIEPEIATSPFSGMLDHAKWLKLRDLVGLLERHGFSRVSVPRDKMEKNGRRVTIWAFR